MYNITWTQEKQKKVLSLIDEYIRKYPYGESIYQSGEAEIDSLELLSEISDILEPVPSERKNPEPCPWDNSHGDHSIF